MASNTKLFILKTEWNIDYFLFINYLLTKEYFLEIPFCGKCLIVNEKSLFRKRGFFL